MSLGVESDCRKNLTQPFSRLLGLGMYDKICMSFMGIQSPDQQLKQIGTLPRNQSIAAEQDGYCL